MGRVKLRGEIVSQNILDSPPQMLRTPSKNLATIENIARSTLVFRLCYFDQTQLTQQSV